MHFTYIPHTLYTHTHATHIHAFTDACTHTIEPLTEVFYTFSAKCPTYLTVAKSVLSGQKYLKEEIL